MKITPIKELRNETKLSQKDFCEKYNIPLKSLQNWESDAEKGASRKCPPYVVSLLKRVIALDYPDAEIDDAVSRLKNGNVLKINQRHEKALRYAMNVINESNISKYIDDIILYGSCARGNATETSDIDLLMVLKDSIKGQDGYQKQIRDLKGNVSTSSIRDPETDLHVSYGDEWRYSQKAYFQNIRREGYSIWN